MVGRDDGDGVHVLAGEHLAEVGEGVAPLEGIVAGLLGVGLVDEIALRFAAEELLVVPVAVARAVHVADGHDLAVVVLEPLRDVHRALVAATDDGEIDAVARRILAEDRRWHEVGRAESRGCECGGGAQKIAPMKARTGAGGVLVHGGSIFTTTAGVKAPEK